MDDADRRRLGDADKPESTQHGEPSAESESGDEPVTSEGDDPAGGGNSVGGDGGWVPM